MFEAQSRIMEQYAMKTSVYLAIDGNHTGKYLEKYILLNDMDGLRKFNDEISGVIKRLETAIQSYAGTIYLSGGDNILARIDSVWVSEILHDVSHLSIGGYSFSAAVAETPQDAYIGLKYAKCTDQTHIRVIRTPYGEIQFECLYRNGT